MRRKQTNPLPRGRRRYSTVNFNRALELTRGGLPIKTAARRCGVPRTTLQDRVLGKSKCSNDLGKGTILTRADEEALVEHLLKLSSYGYGLTKIQVILLASDMVDALKRRAPSQRGRRLSNKWFRCFMRRWPRLRVACASKLSITRAKATTAGTLTAYFRELKTTLDKYELADKPDRIYNVDETNFNAEHAPPRVVTGANMRPNVITSSRIATTTLIACGNAAGRAMPPYYVFKGRRSMPELMVGTLPGSKFKLTDNGWSNSEVFEDFLVHHFLPSLPPRDEGEYTLLMYDGHASHITVPLIEFARQHQIVLFVLPAHTSHVLQPLDVACFSSMKRAYNQECARYMQAHPGEVITRYEVGRLSSAAYLRSMTEDNLQSAFRKSGICPLNPDAVNISDVAMTSTLVTPASSTAPVVPATHPGPAGDAGLNPGCPTAESFLASKTPSPPEKKRARQQTKYRASGVCITDNRVFLKIFKVSEGPQITVRPDEQPGPSGACHARKRLPVCELPVTSDEEDDGEDEACCVCRKMTPPAKRSRTNLEIISWAACDQCGHWVHLKYCTTETSIGADEAFQCPCHR